MAKLFSYNGRASVNCEAVAEGRGRLEQPPGAHLLSCTLVLFRYCIIFPAYFIVLQLLYENNRFISLSSHIYMMRHKNN